MKVSVITATFNSAEAISRTIKSVNSQSYNDIEHIFIDGLSQDNTLAIIEDLSFRDKILVSEKDDGIYDALNKGLSLSSGSVIIFLHADDIFFSSTTVAEVVDAFAESDADVVYGDLVYSNADGVVKRKWLASEFSELALQLGWMAPHPSLVVKSGIYEKLGGFDTRFLIAADFEFEMRLFRSKEISKYYFPSTLVDMRLGGASNKSLKNILVKSMEDWRVFKINGWNPVIGVFGKNLRKFPQIVTYVVSSLSRS